jgi:hypothetical protein
MDKENIAHNIHTHIMEYSSGIKENEIHQVEQDKPSSKRPNKYDMFSLICGI